METPAFLAACRRQSASRKRARLEHERAEREDVPRVVAFLAKVKAEGADRLMTDEEKSTLDALTGSSLAATTFEAYNRLLDAFLAFPVVQAFRP